MLNNSVESGHPCFVPDVRGNAFCFSPFSMMLAVCLLYMASIMLRYYVATQTTENLPAVQETQLQFLGQEVPLEKEVTTYSSILAWNIP